MSRLGQRRGPAVHAHPYLVVLLLLLCSAGCQPRIDAALLPPIPSFDLSGFDPAVREQMSAVIAELKSDPQDSDINGQAGMTAHVYRFLDKAEALYKRAQILDATDVRWTYYLAIALQKQGRLDEAAEQFERASRLSPRNTLIGVAHADALLATGQTDAADARYQSLLSAHPKGAEVWYGRGRMLRQAGLLKESNEAYLRAIELGGHFSAAYSALAQNSRQLGDAAMAAHYLQLANKYQFSSPPVRDELSAALQRLDRSSTTRKRWAREFAKRGKPHDAIRMLELILDVDPEDAGALASLVGLTSEIGDDKKAEEYIETALRVAPNHPKLHFNLGTQRMRQGRFQEAVAAFERAISLDPEDVDSYMRLGLVHENLGSADEAVANYRSALSKNDKHREANFLLGRQLVYARQYEESLPYLAVAATKIDAKRPMYLNMLARAQLENGDVVAAYAAINEASAAITAETDKNIAKKIKADLELIQARYRAGGS